MTDDAPGFTITRLLDAPRSRVWRMWADPHELTQWFNAAGIVTPRESVEIDFRVGGHLRYTMVNEETGETYPTGGVYLEVEPERRLSFTWGKPDDVFEGASSEVVITITLTDVGDQTELLFELRGIAGHPGDRFVHDGWAQALDGLVATAGSGR